MFRDSGHPDHFRQSPCNCPASLIRRHSGVFREVFWVCEYADYSVSHVRWSVCLSVCLCDFVFGTMLNCAETAETIVSWFKDRWTLMEVPHEKNPWVCHEFSVVFDTMKSSWKSHGFPMEIKNTPFPWKFHCAKIPLKSHGMPLIMAQWWTEQKRMKRFLIGLRTDGVQILNGKSNL